MLKIFIILAIIALSEQEAEIPGKHHFIYLPINEFWKAKIVRFQSNQRAVLLCGEVANWYSGLANPMELMAKQRASIQVKTNGYFHCRYGENKETYLVLFNRWVNVSDGARWVSLTDDLFKLCTTAAAINRNAKNSRAIISNLTPAIAMQGRSWLTPQCLHQLCQTPTEPPSSCRLRCPAGHELSIVGKLLVCSPCMRGQYSSDGSRCSSCSDRILAPEFAATSCYSASAVNLDHSEPPLADFKAIGAIHLLLVLIPMPIAILGILMLAAGSFSTLWHRILPASEHQVLQVVRKRELELKKKQLRAK